MTPTFKHNCPGCKLVGKLQLLDTELDFYVCDGGVAHRTSYIARFGNEPGAYYSTAEDILDTLLAREPNSSNGHLILALRQWYKGYKEEEHRDEKRVVVRKEDEDK